MASTFTKVQTSVAESSATLKKISSEVASSSDLLQRVSALEDAIACQSSKIDKCISETSTSLSSLHTKLDKVLLSQRTAAAAVVVPPPPPTAHVSSFSGDDRDSLNLAVTLMIVQGLSVTNLSQTLRRILSRLSAVNTEGENGVSGAAAAEAVFTAGISQMPSLTINVDDDEDEEEEVEVDAEAEDSSCAAAAEAIFTPGSSQMPSPTINVDDDEDEEEEVEVDAEAEDSS